jgi:hypothetical protein
MEAVRGAVPDSETFPVGIGAVPDNVMLLLGGVGEAEAEVRLLTRPLRAPNSFSKSGPVLLPLAVGDPEVALPENGRMVTDGCAELPLAVGKSTLELAANSGMVEEGCEVLTSAEEDLTPYPLFGMNGGGGSMDEFVTGVELIVPAGAVIRGAVPIGALLREEDLGLRVRSPKELVNSSSSGLDAFELGIGVMLAGALVKFTEGRRVPVLPVDKTSVVASFSETS